jgi:predicted ATPase/DNA-binding response OmpR family regulator
MAPQRQHILVIDDDQALREFIARTLKGQGFDVVTAGDEQHGLSQIERRAPALILLSLSLDSADGLLICQRLRQHSAAPIIIYTAFSDDASRLAALDHGADDFLTAPFSGDELLARVRLVLRQSASRDRLGQAGALRMGQLELNLQTQSITRAGVPIALSRTDWALLELLVRHAGQVLTHRMLLQQVWGDEYSSEHGYLRTYINRLRSKLEDDPKNPQHLLTESRIGYRFVIGDEEQRPATNESAPPIGARPTPNLPLPPTSFVGREAEIATVQRLLQRDDLRLLTLAGPGGVGKTRLALQIATRMSAAFADGVCFVALAAVRTPEMLISALAQALQIKETNSQPLFERLKQSLRDKALLLILDNFEQALDAAPLVSELLQVSPQLKVLVTSRSLLRVYGEHELVVQPLALPDPQSALSPDELLAQPAVALFVDRAQAVKPDFALTAENTPLVIEICARLDGLPLAIELAAAWVKILSPQAIAARLSNRLALLTGGARDLPVRQQTLRSTLNWSYDLLDPQQQLLFARLAVFADGGTLESLEEVCREQRDSQMSLLEELAALVDASLLQQHPEPSGETRFVMLGTIHEYAWEQLAQTGEQALMRRRHAQHYLQLAETAASQGNAGRRQWLNRLERELANLRAALEWAREQGESEALIRLAGALWNFWHTHGYQGEGRQWLTLALAHSDQLSLRARALYGLGWLARDQGDYAQAMSYHRESLTLFRELDDKHGIAEALRGVGELALSQGDLPRAKALFEESLVFSQHAVDREDRAWSLSHLGRVALEQGHYAEASAQIEQSLALFRELNVQAGVGWSLHNLGRVALEQGHYAEASALIQESLALFRELGDKIGIGWSLHNLGRMALEQGRYAEASAQIEQGLALFRELVDRGGMAWSHYTLGRAALEQGAHEQARAQFEAALPLFREVKDQAGEAWAFHQLGLVAQEQGLYEQADAFQEEHLRLSQAAPG